MKNQQRLLAPARGAFCRHAYSPQKKFALSMGDSKDMTRQEMRDECDINQIMARYLRSGNVDHFKKWGGQYMDCPAMDYHQAMNTLLQADAMFNDLSAEIRRKFDNSPEQFLLFVQNPKNKDELAELGLTNNPTKPPKADPPVPTAPKPAVGT